MMKKILLIVLLFFQTLLLGQDTKSFSIEMLNERNYPMVIDTNGVYHITISDKKQSIFKMKGITGSNKTEKITWSTKNKYSWSDGIRTDFYPVVNPSSYTKDGIGYSMAGFLPEMKGKMVVIYGTYNNQIDSVRVMVLLK
tara:strand:- start:25 stop:444 length:420 start_codon:yes stop_codon:yes gene_type:complete